LRLLVVESEALLEVGDIDVHLAQNGPPILALGRCDLRDLLRERLVLLARRRSLQRLLLFQEIGQALLLGPREAAATDATTGATCSRSAAIEGHRLIEGGGVVGTGSEEPARDLERLVDRCRARA
jgi:hypothetical protein